MMKKFSLLFVVLISLVFIASCITKEVQVTETYYETKYRTENYIDIGQWHEEYIKPDWTRYAPLYFKSLDWGKEGAITSIDGYVLTTADLPSSEVKLILSKNPQASVWGIEVINITGIGPIFEPPPQDSLNVRKLVNGEVVYIPKLSEQIWYDELEAILIDPKHCLFVATWDEYTDPEITFNVTGVEEFAVLTCTPPHWLEYPGPVVEKVQLTSCEEAIKIRRVPYQAELQRTVIQTNKVPFWELWGANTETQPSSSADETNAPASSAKLIYSDDFSNPDSGWPEKTSFSSTSYYEDGEYHVAVNQYNLITTRYNKNSGCPDDYIIEEDVKLVSGDENSSYGLIFRCQDDNNFYFFLISDGYYLAGKWIDGKWYPLRTWTMCDYVEKGFSSNHLKVVCKGSQIDLYANENLLATVLDDSFTGGYVGEMLYIEESVLSPESASATNVAFDNLKVYDVD
jgi:hypothetical protein